MADHEGRGIQIEEEAESKLSGWSLFGGNKQEEAAELYAKAANYFKLAKNWGRAGAVYIKLVNCYLKSDSKPEAAQAYVDAANCYKKVSPADAAEALNNAIDIQMELGKLTMAAKYSKELGELYEQENDLKRALDFFERAVDLFESEDQTSQGNQCKQKLAQLCAQLEQYPKATEIFEALARQSVNNHLLKYGVARLLLNAGICQLCRGDAVAIMNSLERYQEIDPTFSGTHEYKLLLDLATAMDEGDVEKFLNSIKEFDIITRLDAWITTLLLRVKNILLAKANEEDTEDLM